MICGEVAAIRESCNTASSTAMPIEPIKCGGATTENSCIPAVRPSSAIMKKKRPVVVPSIKPVIPSSR